MGFKSVLIIDNSRIARMIIRKCLEIAGFDDVTCFEAEDGEYALDFLSEKLVDLILTDLDMPKMDGGTLVKILKENKYTSQIPVIVISEFGNIFVEKRLRSAGVRSIIQKPVSPAKIKDVLDEYYE